MRKIQQAGCFLPVCRLPRKRPKSPAAAKFHIHSDSAFPPSPGGVFEKFVKNIKKIYNKIAKCLFVSAKSNQIDRLSNQIEGICAFAGQSAVGKSSLINCLFSQHIAQVGNVSKKIERGKQTTRMVQLFPYSKGYIADTAGFSMLDLSFVTDLEPRELSAYYPDFLSARAECKYRSCLHEAGSDCGVIKAIEKNQISQERYQNYLKILRELKDRKKY